MRAELAGCPSDISPSFPVGEKCNPITAVPHLLTKKTAQCTAAKKRIQSVLYEIGYPARQQRQNAKQGDHMPRVIKGWLL